MEVGVPVGTGPISKRSVVFLLVVGWGQVQEVKLSFSTGVPRRGSETCSSITGFPRLFLYLSLTVSEDLAYSQTSETRPLVLPS